MEVGDPGVEAQEFLSAFPPPEALLTPLLSPCGAVFLLNNVIAAGATDHLLVVDVRQTRDLPDRGPVAAKLVGMDDLWDIVFPQQSGQEGLRSFSVSVPLKENIEHEAVLVDRPPQPMPEAIDARTDLVQMPAGTPTGFLLAKVFSKEGSEFEAPFAEGFVTDLSAALVEQFPNVSVTQGKAVVQRDRVLDDGHWETVAVGFRVGHGPSA